MGSIQKKAFFPAPESSYNATNLRKMVQEIEIYNFPYNKDTHRHTVPLVFMPYSLNKDNISPISLLYFHGNAEDIGHSVQMLDEFRLYLKANIFAIEYPGYGPSTQTDKDPDVMKLNSIKFY